jgi:hypothetical protein
VNEQRTTKVRSRFWNPEELSEYLGVPIGWVYDRTQANGPETIPHIKLGKYIRFNPDSPAFQSWLLTHEVASKIDSNMRQPYTEAEGKETSHLEGG